jgi:hypothetical protein
MKTNTRTFKSWIDVRNHTIRCIENNKSYKIDEFYGPISLEEINSYKNISEFKNKYPKTSFKLNFWNRLRYDGKSTISQKVWAREDIISTIQDFTNINGDIPQQIDFRYSSIYPAYQVVSKKFGSWNKAIEAAGYIPHLNSGWGIETKAKDNVIYRSKLEAYFVDHFLFEKEEYEYEKPYGNGWYFDFYLLKRDVYIEITGGLRPERFQEKKDFCKLNNLNCLFLHQEDIYRKNFKLDLL